MKIKKITISVAMIFAFAFFLSANAEASNVSVNLRGYPVVLRNPSPRFVHERVAVSISEFARSFGGEIVWLPETREIMVFYNGRYIWMQLSNPAMYYGSFRRNADGSKLFTSVSRTVLDVRPYIDNDKAVGQLGAIVEGLGGAVEWESESRTANVIMPLVQLPTRAERAAAAAEAAAAEPVSKGFFDDTLLNAMAQSVYFQLMTADEVRGKRGADDPFILLCFRGEKNNIGEIADVMRAAADLNLRLYGINLNEERLSGFGLTNRAVQVCFVFASDHYETIAVSEYDDAVNSMRAYWEYVNE